MSAFACDRCGRGLLTDADVRYVVKLEITSAYDPMEVTPADLEGDHEAEIQKLMEQLEDLDAEDVENSVHWSKQFDVCATCQRALLRDPLGAGAIGPGGASCS